MNGRGAFVLVPLIGYAGLWLLASPFFILYFRLFRVAIELKHPARMIQALPPFIAVLTVPLCSFASFLITARLVVGHLAVNPTTGELVELGLASLLVTVVLDLLITVAGEKIDIRAFPINLMYLFAWLVIVPAVVAGGG